MTREIKFRAWDKIRKERYGKSDPDGLLWYGFGLFGECMLMEQPPLDYIINLDITQYTGLKDGTGKEIYEGDVVKIKEDWDEYGWTAGETGNVVFSEYFYGISLKSYKKPGTRYTVYFDTNQGIDVEVIGNIYENPDLLIKQPLGKTSM